MLKVVCNAFAGGFAHFGVITDIKGIYRYHWLRDGLSIPGAASAASYTTQPNPDPKAKYSVKVFSSDGSVQTSDEVSPVVVKCLEESDAVVDIQPRRLPKIAR